MKWDIEWGSEGVIFGFEFADILAEGIERSFLMKSEMYPGQAYFWKHNTNIRLTEERGMKSETGTISVLKARVTRLQDVLEQVRELIEGYIDVTDGDDGQPQANKAMRAASLIDEVL